MLVEEALRILITADAGVTALVGARVYPGFLPQNATFPAIVYRMAGRQRTQRLDPRGGDLDILTLSVFHFFPTSQGPTAYSQIKAIDAALFQCLFGYQGTITRGAETLYIDGIHDIGSRDHGDDDAESTALLLGTKQILSQYGVWAAEPRPE